LCAGLRFFASEQEAALAMAEHLKAKLRKGYMQRAPSIASELRCAGQGNRPQLVSTLTPKNRTLLMACWLFSSVPEAVVPAFAPPPSDVA
jgi:hypothetical protein